MSNDSLPRLQLDVDAQRIINALCDEFEDALGSGTRPKLEDYLQRVAPQYRDSLLRELLPLELDADADGQATLNVYLRRLPEYESVIHEIFSTLR